MMRMLQKLSVLLVLSVALAAPARGDTDGRTQHCLQKGFDAEGLDCRLCDRMASHLQTALGAAPDDDDDDDGEVDDKSELRRKRAAADRVVTDCKTCCTDLASIADLATQQQFDRVVLEVCTCKFGRYPKVANFVHHHAPLLPRLEIEYMNARHPHLVFYDADGTKREEISIASWDEDTITEFVQAKLKPVVSDTASDSEGRRGSRGGGEPESGDEASEETSDDSESVDEPDSADETEMHDADDVVEVEVSAEGQ
ncbi:hypothetical protein PINS_up006519 [Pythium insidiosum]|nr:hypothetical protein PINS_up006519 [Pythium insidiosum]